MIRTSLLVLVLITLVAGGLYVGPLIAENKGYVLITWYHYTIEMTAISMVLMIFISLLVIWLVKEILGWFIALFSGSLSWVSHFGSRKRAKAWHSGMLALEMQDYQGAKQQLIKALGGNFNGLELMALARAEYALQEYDNDLWVEKSGTVRLSVYSISLHYGTWFHLFQRSAQLRAVSVPVEPLCWSPATACLTPAPVQFQLALLH